MSSSVQAFNFVATYTTQYPTFLQHRQIVLDHAIDGLDGLSPKWDAVPESFNLANQTRRDYGQNFDTNDLLAYYPALWQARCVGPSTPMWVWIPHPKTWTARENGQCMKSRRFF